MAQQIRAIAALAEDLGSGQHLHGHPQPYVNPVPADPVPASDFCRHQVHTQYTCIQAGKTQNKIQNKINKPKNIFLKAETSHPKQAY